MKELEITELMRDYTDDEFNIEGENAADAEKVAQRVMAKVKPKKMKPLFKVLIAAAVAVSLSAIVGFTYLTYEFSIPGGNASLSQQGNSTVFTLEFSGDMVHPVRLEGDRIIFTYEGTQTDITDLIDEETPYIYAYVHPTTGWDCYVITGGTAADFGYAVVYYLGEILKFEAIGVKYNHPEVDWRTEEAWFDLYDNGEIDYDTWRHGEFESRFTKWFVSAWDQLGYSYDDFSGLTVLDDFDSDISGTTATTYFTKN